MFVTIDNINIDTKDFAQDTDVFFAQIAKAAGYEIAGFAGEIYEDAVICVGPTMRSFLEPRSFVTGRILSVDRNREYKVTRFVIDTEFGQVCKSYGYAYPVYFKDPEKK